MSTYRPLADKRVVNTRSAEQAAELDEILLGRGAIPLSYPCIAAAEPEDIPGLERAMTDLIAGHFDWVAFSSANAVRAVARAAKSGRIPTSTHIAVAGPGTAREVRLLLGVEIDFQPARYTALGDLVGDELAKALLEAGAELSAVTAYRTVVGRGGVDLPALLRGGDIDAVLFTSPSTVDNLALRLEQEDGDLVHLARPCIGCIGPVTSRAAMGKGLHVQVQPVDHTLVALVDALELFFEGKEPS
jgi:uroporphyrinogen-III synthase